MSTGNGGTGAAILPPTVDLDEVSLKVAMASYERARVKCLLGHGQALLDWEQQNPALRAQLLGTCSETVKDTVNTLGDMGLRLVDAEIEVAGGPHAGSQAGSHAGSHPPTRDSGEALSDGIPITERVSVEIKAPAPPFAVGAPANDLRSREARGVPLYMAAIFTTTVAKRYVRWAAWPLTPLAPAGRLVRQSVQSGLERTVYR